MSETVLIALITFASGLGGAVVGAFATYKAASFSEGANRAKILHDEKRAAYAAVFNAFERLEQCFVSLPNEDIQQEQKEDIANCLSSFAYAVTWAAIFAPDSVKKPMDAWYCKVLELAGKLEDPENSSLHGAVLEAVQDDLLSFSLK